MIRSASLVAAALLVCTGCLFGETSSSSNNSSVNANPNNMNGTPNAEPNVTPNNITPNNMPPPPNNVSPNNIAPNVAPNNTVGPICPAVEIPSCDDPLTCSAAPTECIDCGSCSSPFDCNAKDDGLIGICAELKPFFSRDDLDGPALDGFADTLGVGDAILVGRPGFEDTGIVFAFDSSGTDTGVRFRPMSVGDRRYGSALDAHGSWGAVGCDACEARGAVYVVGRAADGTEVNQRILTPGGGTLGGSVAITDAADGKVFLAGGNPGVNEAYIATGTPGENDWAYAPTIQGAADESGFGRLIAFGGGRLFITMDSPARFRVMTLENGEWTGTSVNMPDASGTPEHLAVNVTGDQIAVAANDELRVLHEGGLGNWQRRGDVLTSGSGEWLGLASTSRFLFASTAAGQVFALLPLPTQLIHLGTIDVPAAGPMASNDTMLVIGAPEADGDQAPILWRLSHP